jgi:hypothetical protein
MFTNLVEFLRLGELLRRDLPAEIRAARDGGWEPQATASLRDGIERYVGMAARFARILGLLVFIPLLFVICILVQGRGWSAIYIAYIFWITAVGLAAAFLFSPVLFIAPRIRQMPDAVVRDVLKPFWVNLELFALSSSAGLFIYIFLSWRFTTSAPIVGIAVFLWTVLPWGLYITGREAAFVKVRIGQLSILMVAAFVSVASPVPMKQYQWWARHELPNKIRPVEQVEVTADWPNLTWFTQEGAPNVWYSVAGGTYRLFNAPGYDPQTNAELLPVDSNAKRELIVASFQQRQHLALVEASTKRYLLPGRADSKVARALVTRVNKQPDQEIAAWLRSTLETARYETDASLFTDAFAASPQYEEIVAGRNPVGLNFNLDAHCDTIFTGEAAISYGTIRQPAEMITASVNLETRVFSTKSGASRSLHKIDAVGVGFNKTDALKLALDRAAAQILARPELLKN